MPKERTHLGSSEQRYRPFASSSSRYTGRSFSQNSFGQGCHPSSSGSSRYHGQSSFWNSPKSASPTVKDIKPAANNRKATDVKPAAEYMKEWDEIRCPVCMEHPHNAILLICASYHKGCRPFMCDTSYQRDWRRMEERQNFRDLLSTIQPGIGGHQMEFEVTDFVVEVSLGRRSLSAEPGEGTTIMHWWHDHGGAWQSQFFSDAEEDLELSSDFDMGLSDLD